MPLLHGPVLGEVGPDDFFVWAQGKGPQQMTLRVFDAKGEEMAPVARIPEAAASCCVVFHATGLKPDTEYTYKISSALGETKVFSARTAMKKSARKLLVRFGSCLREPSSTGDLFQFAQFGKPDVFIFAGDNAYYANDEVSDTIPVLFGDPIDRTAASAEKAMMKTQLKHRGAAGLVPLAANTPTLAIWDDHDFGPNNSGADYKFKNVALRCFKRMWANRSYGLDGVPGVFSKVRMGPADIFLLDCRFYRKSGRTLGTEQMGWLKTSLEASDAEIKIIVSSSQVLTSKDLAEAKTGFDNWRRRNSDEYDELLNWISEKQIRGVIFASGDLHLGYLLRRRGPSRADGKLDADIWEITSSNLSGPTWEHRLIPGSEQGLPFDPVVLREVETNNFGEIDIDLDRTDAEVKLRLHQRIQKNLVMPTAQCKIALKNLRVRAAPAPKLRVINWPSGKVYFFRGENYVRVSMPSRKVDKGYPASIRKFWKGLEPGFDVALRRSADTAYFFKDSGYVRYDVSGGFVEPMRFIGNRWRGLPDNFSARIDAAFCWPGQGTTYLFRGKRYLRYHPEDGMDEGYPKDIADGFPGVWADGVDAILPLDDGLSLYFFRGEECVMWSVLTKAVLPGYPKKTSDEFPGLDQL